VLKQSYDVLQQLTPLITEHQGKGRMAGLLSEGPEQRQPQQLRLGGYVLYVTYERPAQAPGAAAQNPGVSTSTSQSSNVLSGGLVIASGPDEFVFGGTGLTVTFEVDTPGEIVGILSVDEGGYSNGQWQQLRRLNGDQTHQGRNLRLPAGRFGIQRIKLYRYR
jgi:hypothetical protein